MTAQALGIPAKVTGHVPRNTHPVITPENFAVVVLVLMLALAIDHSGNDPNTAGLIRYRTQGLCIGHSWERRAARKEQPASLDRAAWC